MGEDREMKQHLDPNAKRDFSELSGEDKEALKKWLKPGYHNICPFGWNCWLCESVIPEIINKESQCPCSSFYVKDVIQVAKEAIK